MNDTTLERLNDTIERMKTEDKLTLRETFTPAMELTEDYQEEADRYFEALVDYAVRLNAVAEDQETLPRSELEAIQRINLAYYAGYYNQETRLRVEKLFACSHPFFGKASNGVPSPEEAFKMGEEFAEKMEEQRTTKYK